MEPVAPHATASAERSIYRPRHPDREAANAAAQRPAVGGLADQVDVIVLDAEFQDPEPVAGRDGETPAKLDEHTVGAQAADRLRGAQRDEHGMGGMVDWSYDVRDAGTSSRGALSASTAATAAPGDARRKSKLHVACHLESEI